MQAVARELSKIAEEALSMLRGELQLSCFFYLRKLALITYESLHDNASNRRSAATQPGTSGYGFMRSTFGGDSASAALDSSKQFDVKDSESPEDLVLTAFNNHLQLYKTAVVPALSPSAFAVVLSPICTLIPAIVMKCVIYVIGKSNGIDSSASGVANSNGRSNSDKLAANSLKSRLLRVVVTLQQNMTLYFQSTNIDAVTKRRMLDSQTEEFERLRRYVSLLDMPSNELKVKFTPQILCSFLKFRIYF